MRYLHVKNAVVCNIVDWTTNPPACTDDGERVVQDPGGYNVGDAYNGTLPKTRDEWIDWLKEKVEAFPVHSIFISAVATNPATLLGYGTWVREAEGRVIVGVNNAQPAYDAAGKTGGAETVTLDVTQLPAHTHAQSIRNTGTAGTAGTQGANTANNATAGVTGSTGGGQPVSVMQPWITAHVWRRVS